MNNKEILTELFINLFVVINLHNLAIELAF
jgi:hypothetical protein